MLPVDLAAGPAALKAAVDSAEAAFGGAGVDVLVHNAAYPRPVSWRMCVANHGAAAPWLATRIHLTATSGHIGPA